MQGDALIIFLLRSNEKCSSIFGVKVFLLIYKFGGKLEMGDFHGISSNYY